MLIVKKLLKANNILNCLIWMDDILEVLQLWL